MRRTAASDDLGVLVRSHRVRRLIASYRLTHFAANCNLTEVDRKSTRLNSSHTEIYTLSLHDALPISASDDLGVLVRSHRVRRLIASYRLTHFAANCNLTE